MGPILDGVSEHMADYPPDETFVPSDRPAVDVAPVLKATRHRSAHQLSAGRQPAGQRSATRSACLETGTSLVNCMPVFIVSDPKWGERFASRGIPVVGDDIKSQLGATIVHRTLAKLFADRGIKLDRTYQLNTGGNTDFLNMLNRTRLGSKKVSKTEAVQAVLPERLPARDVHIGPSDYVPWQGDNKICFLRWKAAPSATCRWSSSCACRSRTARTRRASRSTRSGAAGSPVIARSPARSAAFRHTS